MYKDADNNILKQVQYTYDVFDWRIGKAIDVDGDNTYETAERYVYDGDDIALVFDGSGNLLTRHLNEGDQGFGYSYQRWREC